MRQTYRRPIATRVMIDGLYAEGIRWAGWYNPTNLRRKHDEVFGRYMRGGFGPLRELEASNEIDWTELEKWLKEAAK